MPQTGINTMFSQSQFCFSICKVVISGHLLKQNLNNWVVLSKMLSLMNVKSSERAVIKTVAHMVITEEQTGTTSGKGDCSCEPKKVVKSRS